MTKTHKTAAMLILLTLCAGLIWQSPAPLSAQAPATGHPADALARGEYLVTIMGCNDCHTPFVLGPTGPEPDMSRMLTGHPEDAVLPAPPTGTDAWPWGGAGTNTAFFGPWGVSFTANLTPDDESGLGEWTEQMFIDALRTGRHQGKGRPILPPMPYPFYGRMTDDDLRAVFTYLQSLTPVRNHVPSPIDPPEAF